MPLCEGTSRIELLRAPEGASLPTKVQRAEIPPTLSYNYLPETLILAQKHYQQVTPFPVGRGMVGEGFGPITDLSQKHNAAKTRSCDRTTPRFIRPLLAALVTLVLSMNMAAANVDVYPFVPSLLEMKPLVQDSVPKTTRPATPEQPFETASQSERARTAVILKHTILGTPPPPAEELERQRRERAQKAEERLA